ncbi:hypothetical protein P171DRAFT_204800 [Karstenula rhodostoma CBS 690.94]|uniref:Uncharacterized protein n=1 Tax=Karstenula rhodostoma CBS 690.94 TaxID=1392251 RepID=A0A9P4PVI4_9PLEO|nr:hypothetical protein P171DRAFT_204800 [Karstenula rhodostoma CBS 690.94]
MAPFEHASLPWRTSFTSLGVHVVEVGDAITTRERDAAMTRDSDYDILRYRSEEEARAVYGKGWWPRVSNTEMNERRRCGDGSQEYRGDGVGEGDGADGENRKGDGRSRLAKLFGRK